MTVPPNNSSVTDQYENYNLNISLEKEPNDTEKTLSDDDFIALVNNITENAVQQSNKLGRQWGEDTKRAYKEYEHERKVRETLKTAEAANIFNKKQN